MKFFKPKIIIEKRYKYLKIENKIQKIGDVRKNNFKKDNSCNK